MSDPVAKLLRYVVGLPLFLLGFSALGLDFHVVYVRLPGSQLHGLNAGVELGLVFAGLAVMFPRVARELVSYAKDLLPFTRKSEPKP